MASGSTYVYTTGNVIQLWGYWTAVKDEPNNRSLFTYWLKLYRSGSTNTYTENNNGKIRAKFSDVAQNEQTGMEFYVQNDTNGKDGYIRKDPAVGGIYQFSFYVDHNADGTKQVALKLQFEPCETSGSYIINGETYTVNFGTVTFDAIPRAATISGYSDFNIGSNTVLTVTNPGNLYNTLDFKVTYNETTYTVKSTEGVLSGVQTNLITAADLYSKCPNSNTLQVTAELKTWTNTSKTTQVGTTQTTNANALVTNSNPIFTDFAFEDIDATVKLLTDSDQKLVSGYSDVRATITTANKATAQNYATMVKYRLTIGALTIEENYSAIASVLLDLANILSGTIIVTAIDSRGNQTSVTKTATILSLTGIYFNSAEILRDNGADATVKLDMSGKVHLLNFGTVTNSVKSIKYQYKETSQGDESYTALATISTYSVDGSGDITINDLAINGDLGGAGFDVEKSYDIKIELKDELTTAYLTIELLSGVYVLHLGRTGAHARVGCGMKNNVGQGFQSKDSFYDEYGGQIMPVGAIILWPLSVDNIPTGWILANGATNLSRATYAKLFALYQTTFGNADANTFGVPDLRGLVPVGYKSGDSDFGTLNGTGGSKLLQQHNHGIAGGGGTIQSMQYVAYVMGASGSAGNRTDTIANAGTGNSGNLQPYRVVNYIIKY